MSAPADMLSTFPTSHPTTFPWAQAPLPSCSGFLQPHAAGALATLLATVASQRRQGCHAQALAAALLRGGLAPAAAGLGLGLGGSGFAASAWQGQFPRLM
jgi:hypothetical protein